MGETVKVGEIVKVGLGATREIFETTPVSVPPRELRKALAKGKFGDCVPPEI